MLFWVLKNLGDDSSENVMTQFQASSSAHLFLGV